jgi:hypothetical protein
VVCAPSRVPLCCALLAALPCAVPRSHTSRHARGKSISTQELAGQLAAAHMASAAHEAARRGGPQVLARRASATPHAASPAAQTAASCSSCSSCTPRSAPELQLPQDLAHCGPCPVRRGPQSSSLLGTPPNGSTADLIALGDDPDTSPAATPAHAASSTGPFNPLARSSHGSSSPASVTGAPRGGHGASLLGRASPPLPQHMEHGSGSGLGPGSGPLHAGLSSMAAAPPALAVGSSGAATGWAAFSDEPAFATASIAEPRVPSSAASSLAGAPPSSLVEAADPSRAKGGAGPSGSGGGAPAGKLGGVAASAGPAVPSSFVGWQASALAGGGPAGFAGWAAAGAAPGMSQVRVRVCTRHACACIACRLAP